MSKELGDQGEELASAFLESKGLEILARNFRNRCGEIDIIAKKGEQIVFAEVKFRKDEGFGVAIEFITKKKLEKILKTAKFYLYENDLSGISWRIDAIAIDGDTKKIEWIENIYTEGMA